MKATHFKVGTLWDIRAQPFPAKHHLLAASLGLNMNTLLSFVGSF
jgi:hypothetical protein